MLVDAAKHGDVEIPVFCYEPKLGDPVGACRMCLVEIEGIPKLQTACSTPVRDGMVVHTQTDRVKDAQNAVVEFLLVNHPLDCPVCDKGGECPLQDISMGWGAGQEPRHRAQAPLREADRALAAGRDRPRALHPLLPLRALQPGGRRGRAAAAPRARRPAPSSAPSTTAPTSRPFHGNIIELCPVGALTSQRLPLPRAALGHRGRRLGLHALPEPVQRQASRSATSRSCACSPATTPRSTTAGSATRAASATRCSRRASERSRAPQIRDGGGLTPASWERRARRKAAAGLRGGARQGRRDRRRRHLQRGGLPGPAHGARGARLAPTSTRRRPAPA